MEPHPFISYETDSPTAYGAIADFEIKIKVEIIIVFLVFLQLILKLVVVRLLKQKVLQLEKLKN